VYRDWLRKQAAKAEAAAAAAQARAESEAHTSGKRKRPTIRFQQGDTAEASVLNMFEAKHMGDKVNRDVVRHVFECVFLTSRNYLVHFTQTRSPSPHLYYCVAPSALRWISKVRDALHRSGVPRTARHKATEKR
jgi:hypothetical protein